MVLRPPFIETARPAGREGMRGLTGTQVEREGGRREESQAERQPLSPHASFTLSALGE